MKKQDQLIGISRVGLHGGKMPAPSTLLLGQEMCSQNEGEGIRDLVHQEGGGIKVLVASETDHEVKIARTILDSERTNEVHEEERCVGRVHDPEGGVVAEGMATSMHQVRGDGRQRYPVHAPERPRGDGRQRYPVHAPERSSGNYRSRFSPARLIK